MGRSPLGPCVQDSIVSTNYDLLVEQALERGGLRPEYCLPDQPTTPTAAKKPAVRLFKLHGSANWSICNSCAYVKLHPSDSLIEAIEAWQCDKCGAAMEPFVVPPTWSKGERRASLEAIWRAAFGELITARRWVFIGTSLPETDRFLRYLFGLALQRNLDLDRIVVINPDTCGYDGLFQGRTSKISLERLKVDFEQVMATGRLQSALGQNRYMQPDPRW
jgi:NAD-dependent SIR2 family protein deacetylase